MDTTPVTARSPGRTYYVDGDNLERSYKYYLSDYSTWAQKDHAGDWVLVPDNIGEHLCIDETSLQDDLFTILSNKAGHGRQGTIISMVRGTKPVRLNAKFRPPVLENGDTLLELLSRSKYALTQTYDKWSARMKERMKLLFAKYPKLKEAYDLVHKLRSIFKSKKLTREAAKVKLHEWYQAIADCTLREVKSARDAIKDREECVLNYFINHATNAAAESLNSKLKGFRAQVRGVSDLPFFMYRVCQIFG